MALLLPWSVAAQVPVTNGAQHVGQINPAGDADTWTFSAVAGGSVMIRVGATNFTPRIRLFGPDNAPIVDEVAGNTLIRDGVVAVRTTNAGPHSVLVSAGYAAQTGTYGMHLVHLPGAPTVPAGDEGGELANGALAEGNLTLGDLDVWTFPAQAGDELMVRMGAEGATPWIRIYGPDGGLVEETTSGNTLARDGVVTLVATNAGTYQIVVSARYSGQTGEYRLTRTQAPGAITVTPGDEGGELANGAATPGTLPVGDLDLWAFPAGAGDSLMIRMGASGLTPWIRVYDPAGGLAAETTSGNTLARDGVVTLVATNAGVYQVVAGAVFQAQTGSYTLHLARVPGAFAVSANDEGGDLPNGEARQGLVTLGDLDLWRFEAGAGNGLMLRVGATNLTPWLRLYGPSGGLVAETTSGNTLARDGDLTLQATNAGLYTLVVSATYSGQTGPYSVEGIVIPGPFEVGEGDQGGGLINGMTNAASLDLGDLDVWSFLGTPGDSNVLRVVSTGFTPWIRLYGPDGALLRETTSGNVLARSGQVTLPVTNAGIYTVVVSATYAGQSGTYTFKQSRFPPDLVVPENAAIDEGEVLQAALSAQDPDEPLKPLQFALLSGPPGATLSLAGPTNAVVQWPTSEAEGPFTHEFVVTVTDVVGTRAFTRTNRFPVVVRELNRPPVLTVPGPQALDESTPFAVQAQATDPDLPTNSLTFRLESGPAGMTIDPATGAIQWAPGEADGPSLHTVTVVVEDSSPQAANATRFAVTNAFEVEVREVNRPPVLSPQPDRVIDELTPVAIPNGATDPDLPANRLTYTLLSAPAGAVIGADGVITWTPGEAQGPSTNVFVTVVRDDGQPSASATNQVVVVVREVNRPPQLPVQADVSVDELALLTLSQAATDPDLPANRLSYTLVSAPAGAAIDAAGVVTWTPGEAQGPSTNVFVAVVRDDGTPSASSTNQWTVVVREVNRPPSVVPPTDATLPELTAWSLPVTATDDDLPANALTFRLVDPPAGMTVDSAAGLIRWTPGEGQGPATVGVTLVVTDFNAGAGAGASWSVTNVFRLTVTEVNEQPALEPVADTVLHYGVPLVLAARGSDTDLPANTLVYSVGQGPAGLTIDPVTGAFAWTPEAAQVGDHPVTVRVQDNGEPALSAERSFRITVTGEGARLSAATLPGGLVQLEATGDLGARYELQGSADLRTWDRLTEFQAAAAPFRFIDPASPTIPARFYRLLLRQP